MCTKIADGSSKIDRWVTSDPIVANDAAMRPGCVIAQVFHSREEAEDWVKDDDSSMPKKRGFSDEESDSSERESVALNSLVGKAAKVAYQKKKK